MSTDAPLQHTQGAIRQRHIFFPKVSSINKALPQKLFVEEPATLPLGILLDIAKIVIFLVTLNRWEGFNLDLTLGPSSPRVTVSDLTDGLGLFFSMFTLILTKKLRYGLLEFKANSEGSFLSLDPAQYSI